eukprot:7378091-Prymnesium_polylepis.1
MSAGAVLRDGGPPRACLVCSAQPSGLSSVPSRPSLSSARVSKVSPERERQRPTTTTPSRRSSMGDPDEGRPSTTTPLKRRSSVVTAMERSPIGTRSSVMANRRTSTQDTFRRVEEHLKATNSRREGAPFCTVGA